MKLFQIILLLISYNFSALAATNRLQYSDVVHINEFKGQTFLSLMQTEIKPKLDEAAIEGFEIASGNELINALKKVDDKVANKAIRSAGSIQKLRALGNDLSTSSPKAVTFKQLPIILGREDVGPGRYDLTTYISLVSGGGVAVQIDPNNIAYNVNYGTGEEENDEKTGRSFGESNSRLALDASDKHYLETLEDYIKQGNNVKYFYQAILDILLNNDTSRFRNITEAGQAVATDFIAVYTAEQDRHLKSNMQKHPWDVALLEVTLLSSLHSGQSKIKMMFNGEFTDTTLKQASGCNTEERMNKRASLIDYWQFSSSSDPANCNRSGLNVTKKDFRRLGTAITAYQKRKNPELLEKVQRHFKTSRHNRNVFAQLSSFIVNDRTPKRLNAETLQLSRDFTEFLMKVREEAGAIDQFIVERMDEVSDPFEEEN